MNAPPPRSRGVCLAQLGQGVACAWIYARPLLGTIGVVRGAGGDTSLFCSITPPVAEGFPRLYLDPRGRGVSLGACWRIAFFCGARKKFRELQRALRQALCNERCKERSSPIASYGQ